MWAAARRSSTPVVFVRALHSGIPLWKHLVDRLHLFTAFSRTTAGDSAAGNPRPSHTAPSPKNESG